MPGDAFEVVRDPLWNNIRVEAGAMRLVDTPPFQRLRHVRQLGLAYLVYPGATHSRFEHALGAYHLARRTLALLEERGELVPVGREACAAACATARAAALLHDIGHYPYSHALEEIGAPHHERVATALIMEGPVAAILRDSIGAEAPTEVAALIGGTSTSPLQGLISGSLDLDKIEYLKRDALMCGVPYGEIDVERLLHALVLVPHPDTGRLTLGVHEKALSALESLLFAKYQMYRNVYWHHAVRSATAMYKRLVEDALRDGVLEGADLAGYTDEGLLHRLEVRSPPLLTALRERRLYKRALDVGAADLGGGTFEWIATDRPLATAAEDALAGALGLPPGELLLDFPAKTQMLGLDMPVRRRDGAVHRLSSEGWPGTMDLPALSEQLYTAARRLRVFTARPVAVPRERLLALVQDAGAAARIARGL